jgi:hypothetical protein
VYDDHPEHPRPLRRHLRSTAPQCGDD